MFDVNLLDSVPLKPGVYLWKNNEEKIIYIGKAKSLRLRMKQYFSNKQTSIAKLGLVNEIENFDYIVTNTEKEALTLEFNLIKQNYPKYNVLLIDDKSYPYIRLELKKILSIKITRKVYKDGAFYYGPFPNGVGSTSVFDLLVHLTMFKDGIPYTDENDSNYWKSKYKLCREILQPNNAKFKKLLTERMNLAADKLQFEIANEYKKYLKSLDFYISNNGVEFVNSKNIDVFGFAEKNGYLSITLMTYRFGKLLAKIDHIFEIKLDKEEVMEEFINKYYDSNFIPNMIVSSIYVELASNKVNWIIPKKGKYKIALEIAEKNATENINKKLSEFIRRAERTSGSIDKLAKLLNILRPFHILMIDNSHFQNENPISVVISYKNGVKQKNEYRKFNLEPSNQKSDYDYMQQGLSRYFSKWQYPDLLLVDGGKAQISAAKSIIKKDIPIAGLVKNDKHKFNALLNKSGDEVKFEDDLLIAFLEEIQYEVDRFAKAHFNTRSVHGSLESRLTEIKGLKKSTSKRLIDHFGTYVNIYNASIEELKKVVSENIAKKIKEKFEKNT